MHIFGVAKIEIDCDQEQLWRKVVKIKFVVFFMLINVVFFYILSLKVIFRHFKVVLYRLYDP